MMADQLPVGTMWVSEMRSGEFGTRNAEAPNNSASRIRHSAFGRVGSEEAPILARAMGLHGHAPVLERFARGSRCYVVRIGGALASYAWVSLKEEWISELGLHIRLEPGDAYIWDCATLLAYRGQGLYPALLGYILQELHTEGLRRAWIGADTGSVPSQKGIMKAGFRPVADFYETPATAPDRFDIIGRPGVPEELVLDIRRAVLS